MKVFLYSMVFKSFKKFLGNLFLFFASYTNMIFGSVPVVDTVAKKTKEICGNDTDLSKLGNVGNEQLFATPEPNNKKDESLENETLQPNMVQEYMNAIYNAMKDMCQVLSCLPQYVKLLTEELDKSNSLSIQLGEAMMKQKEERETQIQEQVLDVFKRITGWFNLEGNASRDRFKSPIKPSEELIASSNDPKEKDISINCESGEKDEKQEDDGIYDNLDIMLVFNGDYHPLDLNNFVEKAIGLYKEDKITKSEDEIEKIQSVIIPSLELTGERTKNPKNRVIIELLISKNRKRIIDHINEVSRIRDIRTNAIVSKIEKELVNLKKKFHCGNISYVYFADLVETIMDAEGETRKIARSFKMHKIFSEMRPDMVIADFIDTNDKSESKCTLDEKDLLKYKESYKSHLEDLLKENKNIGFTSTRELHAF
ncbi:hypothetical protein SLOPH_689 [Spraguea lophii 42_110]|uniref:Uncharacterized protein n=1 Tax=Spraguea lophii (strain 42_110) TaxID=1358809 RepID=S7XKV6_SPRLO|nr:hypothetical protein SLOPH_689 [Spraguea lophii 42_110]